MNWETYKQMSTKLKEEYDFKFGDKIRISNTLKRIIYGTTMFYMLGGTILVLILYLAVMTQSEHINLHRLQGDMSGKQ